MSGTARCSRSPPATPGRRAPDRWFDNVEITAGRVVGREPVRYVRDVFKYYAAYKLQLESLAERDAAREALDERRGAGAAR